jgi:neutral ceramidase
MLISGVNRKKDKIMDTIYIGTAILDIKLPIGIPMGGYIARSSPSAGTHDELKVRCIIFDDGENKFALVICDLVALDDDFIRDVCTSIGKTGVICMENIVITCIHTHSGPASIFLQDCGEVDGIWRLDLKEQIIACFAIAASRLKPSLLDFRNGSCSIGLNRVHFRNQTPDIIEEIDSQVGILTIRDAVTDVVDTVLVNYSCHPVVLGPDNLLYSKDFPHYMESFLQEKMGGNVNIIFLNGCLGDINPVETGSFDIAEKLGRQLAESVMGAKIQFVIHKGDGKTFIDIKSKMVMVPLNLKSINYENLKKDYLLKIEEEIRYKGETIRAKVLKAHMHWAEKMQDKINNGSIYDHFEAKLSLIRIGSLIILAMPFEAFSGIGLRLKEHFGINNTMVIGLANGDFAYLPTKKLYNKAREYETGDAHKYYGHPGPVREDAEDIIFKAFESF